MSGTARLGKGLHLAAIGGSDNHNAPEQAGAPGAIGWPTTVVEASELSVAAILEGIRRGRVFIDLTSSRDKVIDLEARDATEHDGGDQHWISMGDNIHAAAGDSVTVRVRAMACPRATIHLF